MSPAGLVGKCWGGRGAVLILVSTRGVCLMAVWNARVADTCFGFLSETSARRIEKEKLRRCYDLSFFSHYLVYKCLNS